MSYLDDYDPADLRRLLSSVQGRESTQQLMLALAHLDGASVHDLSQRYGFAPEVIERWFRRLDELPPEEAVVGVERLSLSRRAKTPVGRESESTVVYLNYAVVDERGWSLDDPDLFKRAAAAGLSEADHGAVTVGPDESILDAALAADLGWPHACDGGACSNCAVYVCDGEVAMSGDHVLPPELVHDGDVRLACVGTPTTETVRLVYGVRHLDVLEDLLLPAEGFDIPTA